MKEPALVFFTVLMQAAAGACAALGASAWLIARVAGSVAAELLLDAGALAVLLLALTGMASSFFHLGNPLRAFMAVANLRTSWLSREILLAALFSAACLALAALQYTRNSPLEMRIAMTWVAALLGLALVYCMSKVYLLRTVPAWNHWKTPLSFFTTAFLLGILITSAVASVRASTAAGPYAPAWEIIVAHISGWRASTALLLLFVQLLLAGGHAARPGLQTLHSETLVWKAGAPGEKAVRVYLGLILSCIVVLVFLMNTGQGEPGFWPGFHWLAVLAFCLALGAEIAGRAFFYARRG